MTDHCKDFGQFDNISKDKGAYQNAKKSKKI